MNFKLTGKEIRCFKIDALTSGCVNYDIAEFTFDEAWDNKTLTAVFRCGEDSEPVMKSLQNSKCVIPSEVLLNKNQKIEVGVIGIDADGVILRSKMCWITTTYEGAPNGKEPAEITPTIYEQFVQDIHNDAVKSEECLKEIKSSVDGFDTHVLDKTSEFNDNAFEKLKEYNDNAANVDKFFQDKVIVATEKAAEANKSADAAKISENNSKISEYNALEYANGAKSSKEISETAKNEAIDAKCAAILSEKGAKDSEESAKQHSINAKLSETNAIDSLNQSNQVREEVSADLILVKQYSESSDLSAKSSEAAKAQAQAAAGQTAQDKTATAADRQAVDQDKQTVVATGQQVAADAGQVSADKIAAAESLKKLTDGIASGDFKGEKGEKGDPGAKGDKGDTGERGIQGLKGDTGAKGDKGDTGAPGTDGKNGDPGTPGKDGAPGADGRTPTKGIDYWTPEDKEEIVAESAMAAADINGIGVHRYGARWDGVNAACTRMYNAVGKVAAAHMGVFDAALVNDFDSIYPWSAMRLCNWAPGTATKKATVTAFAGEPGYDDTANIGAYRPEFWYNVEPQANGGIMFVVADGKLPGYHYSPPYMLTSFCVANDGSGGLQCKPGDIQYDSVSLNAYNTKNAAQGMLTEDYWADGAEKLLLTVEFATLNSQTATGAGFTGARYSDDRPAFAETSANRAIFAKATAEQYVPGKQTIGIGTSWFGSFKASHRRVLSVTPYTDVNYSCVNFDGAPVDVLTTDHVGSMSAIFDGCPVGCGSGYVGTSGKAISYYRGAALQTGAYMWIANVMRSNAEKLWVAPLDSPQTGAISADWIDTDITPPATEGYIKHLAVSHKCPLMVQPDAVGGNSANPVGDHFYRTAAGAAPTALLSRGGLGLGSFAGAWFGIWRLAPSSASWDRAARSLIRNPFGGTGVATPVVPN